MTRTPNKFATSLFVAMTFALVGCGDGKSNEIFDSRPLSERSHSDAPVMSVQTAWWRNAVEASPSTIWRFNGERQRQGTLLVRGTVVSVEPGFAFNASGPETGRLSFNSQDAEVDVVIIHLRVSDGTSEKQNFPHEVKIALPLPAPTDLPSLAKELATYGELAAILYPAVALSGPSELFEILDSRYFGPMDAEGMVTFGSLLEGVVVGVKPEVVAFQALKVGAGTIDLKDLNGSRLTDS